MVTCTIRDSNSSGDATAYNMVFTIGFRHTLALWQRAMALVQSLVVQDIVRFVHGGIVKTFRWRIQSV